MNKTFKKLIQGYLNFRKKYAAGDNSVMRQLAQQGQQPEAMVVACCDSRVDPAVLLQCAPGELFTVRNVANIVPPYENDDKHHGTSAALEFGICHLKVKHLVILGHSQCGGINALLNKTNSKQDDFITNWVTNLDVIPTDNVDNDEFAKQALLLSYQNCLTFPWIKQAVSKGKLAIHLWFFDINSGKLFDYSFANEKYQQLKVEEKASPIPA